MLIQALLISFNSKPQASSTSRNVAITLPNEQGAHSQDQNEEENVEKFRKYSIEYRKLLKN